MILRISASSLNVRNLIRALSSLLKRTNLAWSWIKSIPSFAARAADAAKASRSPSRFDNSALKVRKIVADISIKVGADALIAAVPEIDILINNLGIYEAKPFAEILDED